MRIGRYEILHRVGEGAVGTVYAAVDGLDGARVAVKVLRPEVLLKRGALRRFQREALAIRRIRHPNVVAVREFVIDGEETYLVMELVEGSTLDVALKARGKFTPRQAAEIGRQVASGLTEVHAHGFVHRDLKPHNIMVPAGDELSPVKILDFGVVALLDPAASITKLTLDGRTVGTPAYMAPEQVTEKGVGPSTDLYALGIILYELLTGRPPFSGPVRELMMKQLLERPPPLPEGLGPVAGIVAALLEKEPRMRPASAAEAAAMLGRLETRESAAETVDGPAPSARIRAAIGEDEESTESEGRGPPNEDS